MHRSGRLEAVDAWTRGRPWVADGLLAALLAVLTLPTTADGIWHGGWPVAGRLAVVALLVLGHVALITRRMAPRVSFGVVSALMLVLVATPDLGSTTAEQYEGPLPAILLPSAMIFWIALYSVAAWCSPGLSHSALAVALVGTVLAGARVLTGDSLIAGENTTGIWSSVLFALGLVATVVAAWSLGRFRRVRAQYVASLEERALLEQESRERHAAEMVARERSRIAREMHDVVSHSLAVMVSQAEGGRMMATKDPAVTVPTLETIARTGQEAMRGMRGILDALDPAHTSAQDAPQPTIADLARLLERVREAGVDTDLRESGRAVPLAAHVELAAYRIVQEALTNVLKHAHAATSVEVQLIWGTQDLHIVVRDDGGGHPGPAPAFGRGLTGMHQRVGVLGGSLRAAGEGSGFVVTAVIPMEGAHR